MCLCVRAHVVVVVVVVILVACKQSDPSIAGAVFGGEGTSLYYPYDVAIDPTSGV